MTLGRRELQRPAVRGDGRRLSPSRERGLIDAYQETLVRLGLDLLTLADEPWSSNYVPDQLREA